MLSGMSLSGPSDDFVSNTKNEPTPADTEYVDSSRHTCSDYRDIKSVAVVHRRGANAQQPELRLRIDARKALTSSGWMRAPVSTVLSFSRSTCRTANI